MRRMLLLTLFAVAGVALSCGACLPPTTGSASSYALGTIYVLSGSLPLVVRTDSGRVLRSYGDTLRFSVVDSTYTESGTLGVTPTGRPEVKRAYALPATRFSRSARSRLALPSVLGGLTPAAVYLQPASAGAYSWTAVQINDARTPRWLYYVPLR